MADGKDENYRLEKTLDHLQQYSRRDCIEINGVPVPPLDDPKQIAVEVAELMGIDEITVHHISTAHRLPRTKTVPDRLIVTFVHCDMRDKFYASRGQLIGKTVKDLPLIKAEFGTSITTDSKIYINESLTRYRCKLFGRVNEFHKENK